MPKDDNTVDLTEVRADIKKSLDKIGQEVKEAGEKALAEAKKHGDMYAADKPKVDEMLVKQGELQARLQEVEQKMARRGTDESPESKTVGAQLVESEAFKKWLDSGGMRAVQSGFLHQIKATITSTETTNTTTVGVRPDEQPLLPFLHRPLRVRDLIMPGKTSSNAISYVRQTGFTNNASTVSETIKKPESTITFDWVQSPVVTIAHFIKCAKQILDDMLQLQSTIDGELREGLKIAEDIQLLNGSGAGNNLGGIYTLATAYAAPAGAPGSPTKIDVLRLMLLQAELALLPATGIVLHPSDWAFIELTKDSTGGYIFANPQSLAPPGLWGRPVVTTAAMTIDTALVGAFNMGAQIFDREEINVVIATQNEDDFVRNIITARCEERLALAVKRPEGFIKNGNLPST